MTKGCEFLTEGDHLVKMSTYISLLGATLFLEFASHLDCDNPRTVLELIGQCLPYGIGTSFISDFNEKSLREGTANKLFDVAILLSPFSILCWELGDSCFLLVSGLSQSILAFTGIGRLCFSTI